MRRLFLLIQIILVTSMQLACAKESFVEIEAGQVWAIESDEFSNARVIIQKIALDHPDKPAVHISIIGPFFLENGKIVPVLGHVPISESALVKSLTIESTAERDFKRLFHEGYTVWAETEEAGVYSISVHDILKSGFRIISDDRNIVSKPNQE